MDHQICDGCESGQELVTVVDVTQEQLQQSALERMDTIAEAVELAQELPPRVDPELHEQGIERIRKMGAAAQQGIGGIAAGFENQVVCPGRGWLGRCRAKVVKIDIDQ